MHNLVNALAAPADSFVRNPKPVFP